MHSVTGVIEKHGFSVGSGALACFASVLGKVAFDGDTPVHVMATTSCEEHLPGLALCNAVGLAVQAASLVGMFLANAVMLSTFIKALQMSGSTVATVTNFATNFLLSGVSGRIVFGERLTVLWFCGASLVVSGVVLLIGGTGTTGGDENSPTAPTKGRAEKDTSSLSRTNGPVLRQRRRVSINKID
ncbi:unnamed protein product [Pylaiella littoralis]